MIEALFGRLTTSGCMPPKDRQPAFFPSFCRHKGSPACLLPIPEMTVALRGSPQKQCFVVEKRNYPRHKGQERSCPELCRAHDSICDSEFRWREIHCTAF